MSEALVGIAIDVRHGIRDPFTVGRDLGRTNVVETGEVVKVERARRGSGCVSSIDIGGNQKRDSENEETHW